MLKPKAETATYADLEALPETMVGEILFGSLYAHPRPSPRHGVAAIALGAQFTLPFGRGGSPGGRVFMAEPELHLGEHVVVPDIAGWKAERLTPFPTTAWIETPPDWIAEVLSPSTMSTDRTDKLAIYAAFGVKHCWYVDPVAKTLEVFALADGKWMIAATFKDDDKVAAPPFEVHSFNLDGLWVD